MYRNIKLYITSQFFFTYFISHFFAVLFYAFDTTLRFFFAFLLFNLFLLFHIIFYFMLLSDYFLTLHECNIKLYITSQLFTFYFIIIHLAEYCLSYFTLLFLCYFNLIYCFNYIYIITTTYGLESMWIIPSARCLK